MALSHGGAAAINAFLIFLMCCEQKTLSKSCGGNVMKVLSEIMQDSTTHAIHNILEWLRLATVKNNCYDMIHFTSLFGSLGLWVTNFFCRESATDTNNACALQAVCLLVRQFVTLKLIKWVQLLIRRAASKDLRRKGVCARYRAKDLKNHFGSKVQTELGRVSSFLPLTWFFAEGGVAEAIRNLPSLPPYLEAPMHEIMR